jgi:Protein of unknown function (DUF3738)
MKLLLTISILITLVVPGLLISQAISKSSFQAASVKPNPQSGFSPSSISIAGNRYSATGTTLPRLIMEAYNLRDWQVVGGPSWSTTDQWDVEAVADDGVALLMLKCGRSEQADCGKSDDAIADRGSLPIQVSSRDERPSCL